MRIGLIAGNGKFPFLALNAAKSLGHDVVVVAIREETNPSLEQAAAVGHPADLHWVSLGQLGRCISILKDSGVSRVIMAGQVTHTKLFSGVIPDLTTLAVLRRLRTRNTDALISAVAEVLRDHGIELADSTTFLKPLLAQAGTLTDRTPTDEEQAVLVDIDYPDAEHDLNRWLPLAKWLLLLPHYVVLIFLWVIVVLVVFLAWFVVLIAGRYPRWMFNFVVGVNRWNLRVWGYGWLLVTDRYPPFRLGA